MDWREYQIKEFELRIKLIEVMGKWNIDMATAEKVRAETENLAIKNTILKRIDNQLKLALAELNDTSGLQPINAPKLIVDRKT